MRTKDVKIRFWEKVKRLPSGCWEWTAQKTRGGYGRIKIDGKQCVASRVAWTFAHGSIPRGMFVCHHCDNPPCVRPGHLFVGTPNDNMQDSIHKGRSNPGQLGEAHHAARLTNDDVIEIRRSRASGELLRCIASRFGMSITQIHKIATGARWGHLPSELATASPDSGNPDPSVA